MALLVKDDLYGTFPIQNDAPSAPLPENPPQLVMKDDPPPPYKPLQERWWWKYTVKGDPACCLECGCRTCGLPCCVLTCGCSLCANCALLTWSSIKTSVCCVTQGFLFCIAGDEPVQNEPGRGEPLHYQKPDWKKYWSKVPRCPTEKEYKCAWSCYACYDQTMNCWPRCCVGWVKFPSERTKEEVQLLDDCYQQCHACLNWPIELCQNFWNSSCIRGIRQCVNNCQETSCMCICGAFQCCVLLGRRCCGAPRQEMN